MENTLAVIRESSLSHGDSKLVNRMTSAKNLSSFSGDPLDWIRFKEAFDHSTELGNYSDRETIMRLYDCLKGDARNVVKTLFAGGNSADDIMKTLEMRFGNSRIILSKIVNEIRSLPKIDPYKIEYVDFVTNLKTSVNAIKAMGDTRYLNNSDLANEVLRKLPNSMFLNYLQFSNSSEENSSDLENQGAETALARGVYDSRSSDTTHSRSDRSSRNSRSHQSTVFMTSVNESNDSFARENHVQQRCAHCLRKNHNIENCREFIKAPSFMHWKVARTQKLCFNCLREGHSRDSCKKNGCKRCGANHHTLLHSDEMRKSNTLHEKVIELNTTNKSKDTSHKD